MPRYAWSEKVTIEDGSTKTTALDPSLAKWPAVRALHVSWETKIIKHAQNSIAPDNRTSLQQHLLIGLQQGLQANNFCFRT